MVRVGSSTCEDHRALHSLVSVLSALFICFTVPARADTAPAGKPITFDCVDRSTFDATYYFAPPRDTPLRVTATYGGATHELTRDRDDANGWTFADMAVTVTGSGASVMKQVGNRFSAGCPTALTSSVPAWFAKH